MMLRLPLTHIVLGMLTAITVLPAPPAWAGPKRYVHAASCQEAGAGESGSINRSDYRITNAGTTTRQVICPVPVDPEDIGGSTLVLTVNVEDHHKTEDLTWSICHRDIWGNATECADHGTFGLTNARVSRELEIGWVSSGTYTFVVRLPPNSQTDQTDYLRFFSYSVER